MKAKLIAINWGLSLTGLCVESPFWAAMVGVGWFVGSTALFIWADRRGWMNEFSNKYKLDEL